MLNNYVVNYNDPINAVFAALADPTRRSILTRLSQRDVPVTELAEPYDMSIPAVSKHLKVLERAGLISKIKRKQQRVCHLEAEKLAEATKWLDDYRKFWGESFENLDSYLKEVQLNN